jgi:hypothetical protein
MVTVVKQAVIVMILLVGGAFAIAGGLPTEPDTVARSAVETMGCNA